MSKAKRSAGEVVATPWTCGPGFVWIDEQMPRFAADEPSRVRAVILRAKSKLRRGVWTQA